MVRLFFCKSNYIFCTFGKSDYLMKDQKVKEEKPKRLTPAEVERLKENKKEKLTQQQVVHK